MDGEDTDYIVSEMRKFSADQCDVMLLRAYADRIEAAITRERLEILKKVAEAVQRPEKIADLYKDWERAYQDFENFCHTYGRCDECPLDDSDYMCFGAWLFLKPDEDDVWRAKRWTGQT